MNQLRMGFGHNSHPDTILKVHAHISQQTELLNSYKYNVKHDVR